MGWRSKNQQGGKKKVGEKLISLSAGWKAISEAIRWLCFLSPLLKECTQAPLLPFTPLSAAFTINRVLKKSDLIFTTAAVLGAAATGFSPYLLVCVERDAHNHGISCTHCIHWTYTSTSWRKRPVVFSSHHHFPLSFSANNTHSIFPLKSSLRK